MGGFGSGRTSSAPTVRQCRALDVNRLSDALATAGRVYTVRWGDPEDDSPTIGLRTIGSTEPDVEHAVAAMLVYTTSRPGGDGTDHRVRVDVEWQSCHFGGERPWWRCPACGDRRGKLYLPPRRRRFRCRECYDLGYATARASGDAIKTARLRYERVYEKLAGERKHPNALDARTPEKPTGMHYSTYFDLLDDLEDARREWDAAMSTRLRSLAADAGVDVPEEGGWLDVEDAVLPLDGDG